jgi:hypothetical protein
LETPACHDHLFDDQVLARIGRGVEGGIGLVQLVNSSRRSMVRQIDVRKRAMKGEA